MKKNIPPGKRERERKKQGESASSFVCWPREGEKEWSRAYPEGDHIERTRKGDVSGRVDALFEPVSSTGQTKKTRQDEEQKQDETRGDETRRKLTPSATPSRYRSQPTCPPKAPKKAHIAATENPETDCMVTSFR